MQHVHPASAVEWLLESSEPVVRWNCATERVAAARRSTNRYHAERAPRSADGRQNGLAAVDQEQLLGGGLPAKRPAIPDHPDLQDSGGGSRNTS
jgi:hypothetical protein